MQAWRLISHHVRNLKAIRFQEYLRDGYLYIGWETGDCRNQDFGNRGEIYRFLKENPEVLIRDNQWFGACCVWAFYHEMKIGDLILLKTGQCQEPDEAWVRVVGDYEHVAPTDYPKYYPHRRKIVVAEHPVTEAPRVDWNWLTHDVPLGQMTEEERRIYDDEQPRCALLRYYDIG